MYMWIIFFWGGVLTVRTIFLGAVLFFGLFLITSCSTLTTNLPYANVQSPQIEKKDTLTWQAIKIKGSEKFEVSPDASARPLTLNPMTDHFMSDDKLASSAVLYSLAENVELGFTVGAEVGVQAKYQFLNQDGNEIGTKYVGSLFADLSTVKVTNSGDQNGILGVSGFNWSADSLVRSNNLGVSVGYQPKQDLMVYLGVAYNNLDMKAHIDHSASLDANSPEAHYLSESQGHSRVASIGLVTGKKSKIDLSLNYGDMNFGNTTRHYIYGNLSYSKIFDDVFYGKEIKYDLTPKETWQGRDIGAVAASYFVGFGSGQAIQNNWESKGEYFATADVASLLMMLFSSTRSSTASFDNGMTTGITIFAISRIWQVVDTILDANYNYHRSRAEEVKTK